eukprot:scaffold14722_cov73-Skeletonema_dohrnii-CCMP3373.AAC.1
MAAVPPPLPPLPGADSAPTQPRRKRKKNGDQRDEPGAVAHALAHNIMGKHSATHMFGNVNYSKTYIRGDVVRAFDSRRPGARNAQ